MLPGDQVFLFVNQGFPLLGGCCLYPLLPNRNERVFASYSRLPANDAQAIRLHLNCSPDLSSLSKPFPSLLDKAKMWPPAPAGPKGCWTGNFSRRCHGAAAIHGICIGKEKEDLAQQWLLGAPKP